MNNDLENLCSRIMTLDDCILELAILKGSTEPIIFLQNPIHSNQVKQNRFQKNKGLDFLLTEKDRKFIWHLALIKNSIDKSLFERLGQKRWSIEVWNDLKILNVVVDDFIIVIILDQFVEQNTIQKIHEKIRLIITTA